MIKCLVHRFHAFIWLLIIEDSAIVEELRQIRSSLLSTSRMSQGQPTANHRGIEHHKADRLLSSHYVPTNDRGRSVVPLIKWSREQEGLIPRPIDLASSVICENLAKVYQPSASSSRLHQPLYLVKTCRYSKDRRLLPYPSGYQSPARTRDWLERVASDRSCFLTKRYMPSWSAFFTLRKDRKKRWKLVDWYITATISDKATFTRLLGSWQKRKWRDWDDVLRLNSFYSHDQRDMSKANT